MPMPYRTTPLASDQYYHVYNRGVARIPIFTNKREYDRFLQTLFYYRFTKPPIRLSLFLILESKKKEQLLNNLERASDRRVEIVSFVLMPNHFHLLVQQKTDQGISGFIGNACNSYTKYINTKHRRVGTLFQGPFKAVRVESDEQLLHLSRYIHLNPLVSFVVKKEQELLTYPWSSLGYYIQDNSMQLNTKPVLNHFKTPAKYIKFVLDQADYGKKLEKIKHLALEHIG